jgi:hypothetical protein
MNSVIVFLPVTVSYGDLGLALGGVGTLEETPHGGLVVLGPDRLYVHRLDDPDTYYDPDELNLATTILGEHVAYTLDYTDIRTVKQALILVESRWLCLIDNDVDPIAPGSEFADRMRRDPEWDWRVEGPE